MKEYTLILHVELGRESWLSSVLRHLSSIEEAKPGIGEIVVRLKTKNREELSLMKEVLRNLMHVQDLYEPDYAMASA